MADSISERLMGMSDDVWARHANPWSVWTRVPIIVLLTAALWSRVLWGWWSAVAVAMLLLWIWLNPRVFPRPQTQDHWGTKAVLGEQIWLHRKERSIPKGFAQQAVIGNGVAGIGGLLWLYGVIMLDPWASVTGASWTLLGKLWFLDRCVWLYEKTEQTAPSNLPPDPSSRGATR
ncbi:MAG: DUF6653 family protein [Pseudomonadota bacterium]